MLNKDKNLSLHVTDSSSCTCYLHLHFKDTQLSLGDHIEQKKWTKKMTFPNIFSQIFRFSYSIFLIKFLSNIFKGRYQLWIIPGTQGKTYLNTRKGGILIIVEPVTKDLPSANIAQNSQPQVFEIFDWNTFILRGTHLFTSHVAICLFFLYCTEFCLHSVKTTHWWK